LADVVRGCVCHGQKNKIGLKKLTKNKKMEKPRGLNFEALKEKCNTIGELIVEVSKHQTLSINDEDGIFLKLTTEEREFVCPHSRYNDENFAEALVDGC
jgi:hypothetical protein